MSDAPDKPASRPRRRKLRIGVAAGGLFLAAFVGFWLAPDRGRDDSVNIIFEGVVTNQQHEIELSLAMTNAGNKQIHMIQFVSEFKTRRLGEWRSDSQNPTVPMNPGESWQFGLQLPQDTVAWRGKILWHYDITRFQRWRFQVMTKARSFMRSSRTESEMWWDRFVHTNYSAEFPR